MPHFGKVSFTALALIFGLANVSHAASAPELIIEDFVGTINWANGEGDIQITDQKNVRNLNVYEGDEFVIDGGIKRPDGDKCSGYRGQYDVSWFGKKKTGVIGGYEGREDLPILTLNIPRDTKLTIRNAIVFTDGAPDIGSANLSLKHCGNILLGNVTETLNVTSKGSGDVKLKNAGKIEISMSGSSDIEAINVGTLISQSRGSGDMSFKSVDTVDIDISGSSDIEIDVITGNAIIESSGSSDVDIGRINGSLEYQISGSGDLSIDEIGGEGAKPVTLKSSGSGNTSIDSGRISRLVINSSGSSNVEIDAIVEDLKARASGSSDIYIDTVTGSSETRASGSSDIEIDNRS